MRPHKAPSRGGGVAEGSFIYAKCAWLAACASELPAANKCGMPQLCVARDGTPACAYCLRVCVDACSAVVMDVLLPCAAALLSCCPANSYLATHEITWWKQNENKRQQATVHGHTVHCLPLNAHAHAAAFLLLAGLRRTQPGNDKKLNALTTYAHPFHSMPTRVPGSLTEETARGCVMQVPGCLPPRRL